MNQPIKESRLEDVESCETDDAQESKVDRIRAVVVDASGSDSDEAQELAIKKIQSKKSKDNLKVTYKKDLHRK